MPTTKTKKNANELRTLRNVLTAEKHYQKIDFDDQLTPFYRTRKKTEKNIITTRSIESSIEKTRERAARNISRVSSSSSQKFSVCIKFSSAKGGKKAELFCVLNSVNFFSIWQHIQFEKKAAKMSPAKILVGFNFPSNGIIVQLF